MERFCQIKEKGNEAIARWEKFRFHASPSRHQLEALAKIVGVDADRLTQANVTTCWGGYAA
ncbi:hypothetical protein [Nostoc linckia]|uniref:hypothetical protein n=1 Tax=Nostoc linckia TaxID=92942 RepID=UPI001FD1A747|nr:hypothetical protein [Nostoc linckia]